MSTSGSYNYTKNQDTIIKRAMRISGNLATGDTPTNAQYLEAQEALNDIAKEWEADGMQLWCVQTITIPITAGVAGIDIGIGTTNNFPAFLKVLNCWKNTLSDGTDIPMVLITRNQYEYLSNKTELGDPNQYWYNPPGHNDPISLNAKGTLTLFNTPNTFAATTYQLKVTGQVQIQDFTDAIDEMDFPSYFANALTWGLADQLAMESPLPVSEKDRIMKKMLYHKEIALGFGTEMGSLFIQPDTFWMMESQGTRF